jgi:hypothetical protein
VAARDRLTEGSRDDPQAEVLEALPGVRTREPIDVDMGVDVDVAQSQGSLESSLRGYR